MAQPPIVRAASKDPRFRAMMADAKAQVSLLGKLRAAGANRLFAGQLQPDRLTLLRRVATRLVLEDALDGKPDAPDLVNAIVAGLSGLQQGKPGSMAQTQAYASVQTAVASLAMVDQAAAGAVASWIADAQAARASARDDWMADRAKERFKEGLRAPFEGAANVLEPLIPLALALGGLLLLSRR